MQLPQAALWSLLLAGADAQFRALRRDSGLCSVEIVNTVVKTYTITTSEEVVLPCKTGGNESGPAPTGDGGNGPGVPSAPSASSTSSPEVPDSPDSPVAPPKPGKGENIDSNLPFDSLIPSGYFPDVTIEEPSVPITSLTPPTSTASVPGNDDEDDVDEDSPVDEEPSSTKKADAPAATATDATEPVETDATEPDESKTVDPSEPKETESSEPSLPEDEDEDDEDATEPEVSQTPDPSTPEVSETPKPADPEDNDSSEVEPSDDASTPEPTPTSTPPAEEDNEDDEDEEPADTTTAEAETTTAAPEEEPEETSTVASSTSTKEPEPTLPARNYPADIVDKLQDESMEKLKEHLKRNASPGCTLENAAVRREWGDLSVAERKEYSKAVQCLQNKPAKTPSNVAAGAKSRFDDFVVTHIQQTGTIHNTANFLAWHRYYTWAYETALRDECGYTGYQPYWNWDRYANDPVNSPIFDGGEGSLGGNSNGGGCAQTGPFDELKVNMGPGYNLNYNPRCLKRDVQRRFAQQCTADKTMSVLNENSITRFQDHMQYSNGIHAGGHFTIGGDPGGDVFTSPGDPVFYLHHAMIDRVWWIWQLQDLDTRLSAVGGSVGGGSNRQGTLQDSVSLGYAGESTVLGELMNTMGGKGGAFCYIYV
ncbi:Di-copper centre-containing protein [Sarocladium strictum]